MTEPSRPLRIAVLTSSSAPGIEQLLVDQNRGSLFELVAVISTEPDLANRELIEAAKVPVVLQPIRHFHQQRGLSTRNLIDRHEYDVALRELLIGFSPDWVILDGYHYIVTEPLLDIYANHVLCIHEGDLTQLDEDGHRKYIEMHAVRRAIFAGERETRSSLYFATDRVGEGPLFLLSKPYPVAEIAADGLSWGAYDLVNDYVKVHRDWMVRSAGGEMISHAIGLIAAGTIRVANDIAWVDGVPGPCRMGEAPRACHVLKNEVRRGIPSTCPFIES